MDWLKIIQIIIAIALIISILLQNKGGSLSGIFGGTGGNVYMAKRGFDNTLFTSTIVLAVLFFVVSISVILL